MRSLLLSTLFVLASGFVLAQDPVPAAGATGTEYYPLKKGNKWTYKYNEADVVVEVASVDKDEYKLDTKAGGKVVASETLKVMADGIYRSKINTASIEPPIKILEFEAKDGKMVPKAKGTKWKVESKVQGQDIKGEFAVIDTQKVKTPMGEVDAVLVEAAKLDISGMETTIRYWFAPGKGVVKLSYSIANNEAVLELKSFEEGK